MKKYLKLVLSLTLSLVLLVALTGCGEKTNEGTKKTNGEYQGATDGAEDSLKNVTDKNYITVAKSIFGMEIENHKGWAMKKVESPNKVNNLIIDYDVNEGEDAKSIIETYFDKSKALAKDGVYSYGMNEAYTGMVKKDKYEDFNTFAETNLTNITDFYQTMWIYDNNEKTVLFSINIDAKSSKISFTLLG